MIYRVLYVPVVNVTVEQMIAGPPWPPLPFWYPSVPDLAERTRAVRGL